MVAVISAVISEPKETKSVTVSIVSPSICCEVMGPDAINFHFLNAEFSKFAGILSAALSQHHLSGCEIVQLEFHHLH